MKIARYRIDQDTTYGVLTEDGQLKRLRGSPYESLETTDQVDALDDVRLLAPVEAPRVFGAGLNYVSHIAEAGQKTPEIPMLFMKPTTAVIGPDDEIVYPTGSTVVHFEGELTAIIGRKARHLSEDDALDAVLGYTCGNDVSERTVQFAEMAMGTMLVGKSFDTFCPIGPIIATGLDPTNLELEARLNGERRQHINTSDLLFSVAQLVAYLSRAMTLLPGDVLLTGTPAGVGPVAPGDMVEIEIGGIGVLRNSVVAESTG
ncbi:MAG TPA: fumarylacetoacetate hydrolase family protein [Alphaproteobacteria bacterium]|nr:fumarylacetoacetate hydrolase family protein [Alphaproteobacteria bacterium]